MNYKELRKKYPEFNYKSFEYKLKNNDLYISFLFEIGKSFKFSPTLVFKNILKDRFLSLDKNVVNNFVFHIGLAEIPTYWKSVCASQINIEAGFLNAHQILWWKDLFIKGMSQYFFENKIDFTDPNFINLESVSSESFSFDKDIVRKGVLVPVGGGKDSAATLELLKDQKRLGVFLVNPTKAAENVVKISGISKVIKVERYIDPKLLELNKLGFLNGHTPFSSVIAFLSIFASYLYGFSEVVLSNERSSDEENTSYLDRSINHQYSKTFEFENKFRDYVSKYITSVNYFSFLRPLYEIQIAKIFAKIDKYSQAFRSCNVGQNTNSWCGNCSKCLSTYILLKPFLPESKLIEIFGENLLSKKTLKPILSELIDPDKVKPFECVGTRTELLAAINGDLGILELWNSQNNVPKNYERILRQEVQK